MKLNAVKRFTIFIENYVKYLTLFFPYIGYSND